MDANKEKRLTRSSRSSLANSTLVTNAAPSQPPASPQPAAVAKVCDEPVKLDPSQPSSSSSASTSTVTSTARQSARRLTSTNHQDYQYNTPHPSSNEHVDTNIGISSKSDMKPKSLVKTRSKQSLKLIKFDTDGSNQVAKPSGDLVVVSAAENFNVSSVSTLPEASSNIKTVSLKKKATSALNQLKIDSLSSSFNSAINKSNKTSNIITRKRHMSFSTELNNSLKLSNNENLDNLNNNEDSNSSSNLNMNASSSNLADSFGSHSKRFKFKFNTFEPAFESSSSLNNKHFENANNPMQSNEQERGNEVDETEMYCPVENCDSMGHLDGMSTRHFSFDTCPSYFGMTFEECTKRKLDLESKMSEFKTKLEQINENRKNLRNKQPVESQLNYFQLLKAKLKDKSKPNEQTLKNHLCDKLIGNTDLLTDIKNITTSTLLNSMSIGINPTTSHASTSSSLAANKLIKSNIIYSCFNDKSLTPTLVDDLNVSKFEIDLFKDALVSSSNSKEDQVKKLTLPNKNHKIIQFGNFEIETWYNSPYPDDYWQLDKIFICQYCLIYMKSHSTLNRHLEKCLWRHPPGREIYRKNKLSFFEVDGKFNKAYCQNLCLLAKLFLDHKTLYYDVEPFLFYVLTKYNDTNGSFEMIGYFSKEKQSVMNYNLSCILILPPFMNHSYGKLLIDFSYLLSKVEEKFGSPERPLSDLGLISYRNYWKTVLLNYLSKFVNEPEISIKEASLETGILSNDIISTLQFIGLIKYWKGKHVLLKDTDLIEKYVQKLNFSELKLDFNCLKWTPYVWQTIINESDTPALSVFAGSNKLKS